MADVKWIKITTDVFDDDKILLIESLPEADSIIVIWFKLLCLAGKQNNNGVFILGNKIAYTDKMLATIFRRKEATVQLALKTFEEFGMVELVDGVITIPNWEKHQNLESLENIKEKTRKRVAKHREKQKLLLSNVTSNVTDNVTSDVTVTLGNAIDKSREDKIREEEKREEGESKEPSPTPPPSTNDEYNSLIKKYGKAFVDERIERAKKYSGTDMSTVKKWCEEDFKKQNKGNRFNNFPQRDYDYEELEKDLLNRKKVVTAKDDPDLMARVEAMKSELGQGQKGVV